MIKNAEIQFHRGNTPFDLFSENQYFGILEIEMNKTSATTKRQEILFSIDVSGSMLSECKDGRSKMEHAKNTTKKIIEVLSNLEDKTEKPNIWVSVNGFDSEVKEILPWTKINKSELSNIIEQIENLIPRDSTNIELALKEAEKSLKNIEQRRRSTRTQKTEKTQKTHIFLTDGNATDGETNPFILSKMTSESGYREESEKTQNTFVGLSSDHNGHLLQKLASSTKDGTYYFINDAQHSGVVFGEIVYEILYKAVEEVEIKIENGEIYDYKTNSWSNTIKIKSLVGEWKKTYHIRTTKPKKVKAIINGNLCAENTNLEKEVLISGKYNDLTKFILRQRTQELLYETTCILSKELDLKYEDVEDNEKRKMYLKYPYQYEEEPDRDANTDADADYLDKGKSKRRELKDKKNTIKNMLKDFMDKMSMFMEENKLDKDEFYVCIYEDMKTTYKTLYKNNAFMYSCARQHSQGRQCSYSPRYEDGNDTDIDDNVFRLSPSPIRRKRKDNNINVFSHLTMENTTPTQRKLMRDISGYISSSSPPLVLDKNINIDEMEPLTEMENIFLG